MSIYSMVDYVDREDFDLDKLKSDLEHLKEFMGPIDEMVDSLRKKDNPTEQDKLNFYSHRETQRNTASRRRGLVQSINSIRDRQESQDYLTIKSLKS